MNETRSELNLKDYIIISGYVLIAVTAIFLHFLKFQILDLYRDINLEIIKHKGKTFPDLLDIQQSIHHISLFLTICLTVMLILIQRKLNYNRWLLALLWIVLFVSILPNLIIT